jgi:hypothetical protein
MARLPLKLQRNYVPGGPLFAMRAFKLGGVMYERRDPLPIAGMSKVRHQRLWQTGLADHTPHGPFDKRRAKKDAAASADAPLAATAPAEPPPSTPSDAGPAATTSPEQAARPAASTVRPPHNHKRR